MTELDSMGTCDLGEQAIGVALVNGKFRRMDWPLYVMSTIFVVYFALHPLEEALGIS